MKSKTKFSLRYRGTFLQFCIGILLVTSFFLGGCTQRTITTKKRTYSIKGSGSEPDDSDKMRERYTSGYQIGDDGMIQTDKKDLYENDSFRDTKDNNADLKSYRMGKKDLNMKEYRTPEYLTRQKDYRTKESRMDREARESDVERFTMADGNEEARIKKTKPGFLDWLNPFSRKKGFQESEKSYRTSSNRGGSRAMERAPIPEPMSEIGASPLEQSNPSLSMDDVKKMLNPESYGRAKR